MGRLVDGKWTNEQYCPMTRAASAAGACTSRHGRAGALPSIRVLGVSGLHVDRAQAEEARSAIGVMVDPFMGDDGWFSATRPASCRTR
jgi:hypothetical protein